MEKRRFRFGSVYFRLWRRTEPPLTAAADLVVCTDLEPAVYEPVVKEFEERTGLTVEVQAGTLEEIRTWFAQEQTERNGDGKPDRISRKNGIWPLA